MARTAHQLLEIHLIITECGSGFAPSDFQLGRQLGFGFNHTHATSTAAPACLQHQGVTHLGGHRLYLFDIVRQRLGGGYHRHTRCNRRITRSDLIAQRAHDVWLRPNESDTVGATGLGKIRILRQKTITRVNRIHPRLQRKPDDVVDIQISGNRLLALTHQITFIGFKAVQRETVFRRIDRYRADT